MLEEMLRAEAASNTVHFQTTVCVSRYRTSTLARNRERWRNRYCKQDEEQNRKSRPDEDGVENGTMVGIECGIKTRTKSMFGIGIRNGTEVRNQSEAP
ncbi:hypothetical protein EVAR_80102_1 [Eumeta japonica]|uniref:Uncharacterized protein n=1 Tax=Eumeta variegata TaxID=151549 RepID=A0A4C1UD18_EUMVA|nr:hypothetical protein EVAR_80102_1 [Eumeta japonica]